MSTSVTFQHVSPIGDTDPRALPVSKVGPAVAFYSRVLGFTLASRGDKSAVLRRDAVEIGLVENDADPEQASCHFAVSDVEALREELEATGIEPSPLRTDTYGEKKYRVFFAREPYGVCFCFGQEVAE